MRTSAKVIQCPNHDIMEDDAPLHYCLIYLGLNSRVVLVTLAQTGISLRWLGVSPTLYNHKFIDKLKFLQAYHNVNHLGYK